MERFAFKIDAALRANLYKICRLCGIDNPSKVPILTAKAEIIDLDEPSLSQKVFELVGFTVTKDDKMPQTMCSLCVDKINDFYEFREMCYATNKQTRNLLGLKQADPQKLLDIKPIFKSEPLASGATNKRGRKRKTEDNQPVLPSGSGGKSNSTELPLNAVKDEPVNWRKKQRLQQQQQLLADSKAQIKEEPSELEDKLTLAGKKRRKASCSVCGERFVSKELAEEHKSTAHVPSILRYACHACNQTHHSQSDIKAHQLWHKLSKTPYQCPLCNASVANNYAFTRHLREHTVPTPIGLLVLDRECPLCKKTFLTNFFYNTHPCARRTRKCGGCNRALTSEVAYMRHAPLCAKIYLHHSKHIMPEAADNESQMRIKNEFGVDVEDNALPALNYVPESEMQPVVVLERLSSPLLRASGAPNSLGKNNDRVSTKSYLKRVDQLLKNTMSTLVSIKHEPEVHIDDTGPEEQAESEPEEEQQAEPAGCDDFHFNAGQDDSDEEAAPPTAVAVKQELIDEAYGQQAVQIKQEPLKLKLKITNNHGQLNSSIVDDDEQDSYSQSRSAKKKKKRKHRERNKETPTSEANPEETQLPTAAASVPLVSIKQERLDNNYEEQADAPFEPQATVMTSIPMLQLDNSYGEVNQQPEDVKPNRLELDRLLQITHIASGVVMAEEAMPPERAVEALPQETPMEISPKASTKSTARKSTAGAPREANRAAVEATTTEATTEMQLPQIVSVESGSSVPFNLLAIKPEPMNRGYADEEQQQQEEEQQLEGAAAEQSETASNEINHNEKLAEEAAYINSLDLSNVTIKQEKDLHISDVSINEDNVHFNGLPASENSDNEEEDEDDEAAEEEDDSASSADEAEEQMDTYEEEEEEEQRIYREIELQPLEEQLPVESAVEETADETEQLPEEKSVEGTLEEAEQLQMEQKETSEPLKAVNALTAGTDSEMREDVEDTVENTAEIATATLEEELEKSLDAEQEEATTMPQIETPTVASLPKANTTQQVDALQNPPEVESVATLESQAAAIEPQLTEDPAAIATEPEEATTTAPAFSFVITSVCSQAVEPVIPTNEQPNEDNNQSIPESLEKTEHCEQTELNLSAPKESETLAQPFSSNSTNYNCAEEQQNVLNHELLATEQQQQQVEQLEQLTAVEGPLEEELEAAEQTDNSNTACNEDHVENSANEETENRINEQQQQQQQQQQEQQQQQQQQHQQRCEINDNSNINEIAENNNNANIERELNDDANVAQENPNI